MMALWRKSILEARWLLLGSMALMFAFQLLFIWLTSLVTLGNLKTILSLLPPVTEKLSAVPLSQVATSAGRIAVAYDHPVVLLLVTVWAISRGSDAVSGPLGRGTLEMVLAQPVTRAGVLAIHSLSAIVGAGLLCLAGWLGTWTGVHLLTLEEPVAAEVFVPAALNLFALTVFVLGLTTLASAWDNTRSRTIGVVGAFYAIEMIVKIVGRSAPGWEWVNYFSFFTPFEPQRLVGGAVSAWQFSSTTRAGSLELGGLGYNAILTALAIACFVLAAIKFSRRDLPAPL